VPRPLDLADCHNHSFHGRISGEKFFQELDTSSGYNIQNLCGEALSGSMGALKARYI